MADRPAASSTTPSRRSFLKSSTTAVVTGAVISGLARHGSCGRLR